PEGTESRQSPADLAGTPSGPVGVPEPGPSEGREPPRDVVGTLTGFARTLRAAGVNADPERLQAMSGALDRLDVTDAPDAYWAGGLTLCAAPADLPRYDRCFAAYFTGESASVRRMTRPPVIAARPVATAETAGQEARGDPSVAAASTAEVLRRHDVARLS